MDNVYCEYDVIEAVEWNGRAVLLVDLDAFFASVEQLDHPGWRGHPVIVGGSPDRRGVVSTASYEARKFGVHSAMPSATAEKLCPNAFWTRGHYDRYREVSESVMSILLDETPLMQQVSIDEAFLDVSPTTVNREHPVRIAKRIQKRVEELGVTCSIGVGSTKSIAKIASDMDKPRGLTVVLPGSEANFLHSMPVRALSGVGPAAERKLKNLGIETLGELAEADDELITRMLGKAGEVMLSRARCEEDDPVVPDCAVKSISNEASFSTDLTERDDIVAAVRMMSAKVGRRLRRKGLSGHTITLKVRYSDRSVRSVQRRLEAPCDDERVFDAQLNEMIGELWDRGCALRLVGVAVTGFDGVETPQQLSLFESEKKVQQNLEDRGLIQASDRVKEKYGDSVLKFGRELRLEGRDTGTTSKGPADYKEQRGK